MVFAYDTRVLADVGTYTSEVLTGGTASWMITNVANEAYDSYNQQWQYMLEVNINYEQYTRGYVTISTRIPVNARIMCENCTIYNSTDSGVTVKLSGVKNAKVVVFKTMTSAPMGVADIWDSSIITYTDSEYGQITTLNTYLVNANNILTQMSSTLGTINTATGNIYAKVDDVELYLLELKNKINNIGWQDYTPRNYSASVDNVTYSNDDITSNVKDIYVRFAPIQREGSYIYRIDTGVSSNNYLASMNAVEVIGVSNVNYNQFNPSYYIDRSGRNIVIYIYDTLLNANNDTRYIIIHLNGGRYYLRYRNDGFNIKCLPDTDENYWRMIGVFKQGDINVDLGDVTVSVTPEIPYTQEDVNNVINNIDLSNEIHSTIGDIINNFELSFTANNEDINLPTDAIGNGLPMAQNFMTSFTSTLANVPYMQTLMIYILICSIIVLLLGG